MSKILSISVMAHESRTVWFPYLRSRLGSVPFLIDKGRRHEPDNLGVWENCKRAWLAHDPKAQYHCVIQDDAIICNFFYERAEAFLQKYGTTNRAVSFYYGNKKRVRHLADIAIRKGKDHVVKKVPSWGVAICLPTSIIPTMIKECDQMKNPQDDVRIAKFLVRQKMLVYFPMPCLVNHRAGEVSLVGDPGPSRQAAYFIDNHGN